MHPELFASPAAELKYLTGGGMLLRSTRPLRSYPRRLTDRLVHWATRTPEVVFLAERQHYGDLPWRTLTYSQALAAVRNVGQALLARELGVDRPVAILADNGVDHAVVTLAAMHVGVPVVPISPAYATLSTDFSKLRHILEQVTPGLVFVGAAERFASALAAVAPRAAPQRCPHAPHRRGSSAYRHTTKR